MQKHVRLIQKRMQYKENLGRKLQKLQEECINDYFQTKLEAITSKEVIKDIIEGFVAINNQQFFQSIAQTIDSVKKDNQQLSQQLKLLKKGHEQEVQTLQKQLKESELRSQKQKLDINLQFQEKIMSQKALILQLETQNSKLLQQITEATTKSKEYQLKIAQKQQELNELKQKLQEVSRQNNKLTIELQKTKQSSMKFRQSCEKLMKQANRQRQKAKEKLIEDWTHEKEIYEQKQQQLTELLQNKDNYYLQQKALQHNQYEAQISALKNQLQAVNQNKLQLQALQSQRSIELQKLYQLNQQSNDQLEETKENLKRVEHQKQSLRCANYLLQEENKYLRSTIISFDQRYKALEQQKTNIQRNIEQIKASSNEEINKLTSAYQQLKQQSKLEMQRNVHETETSLKQIAAQLQFLKQRQQMHKQNQSILSAKIEEIQIQLLNCKQQNVCLSQQLKLHYSDSQLHENEIKLYENQILKLNQSFRAEMQLQKQTFQANWNNLNEELLEEKYKKAKLQQQLQKARQEIALHQEKEKVYELYNEEIAQLKAHIQIINNYQAKTNRNGPKFFDFKSKFYYYISKANQDIKKLKKENKNLKETVFNYIKDYRTYLEEIFSVTILRIRQQSLKCLLCEHQKSFKSPEKTSNEQIMFKKTLPKLSNAQSLNYSNIKKALKNINQRCQAINQENKQYTDHIDGVIKKI